MLNIIVASDLNGGIGYNNIIPWFNKNELNYFRKITSTVNDINKINVVIMGRKTWESLPSQILKNRINVVISKTLNKKDNIFVYENIEEAINYYKSLNNIENIFIIGGESIYNECINKFKIDKVYLSLIIGKYKCNKFFNIKPILKNYYISIYDVHFNEDYITLIAYNKN